MPNIKNILIIVPVIALFWVWNVYGRTPAAPLTTLAATNLHTLSANLADTKADAAETTSTQSQTTKPVNAIVVTGDADLKPENIKKGVSIFGVEGTLSRTCESPSKLHDNSKRWCDNQDGTVTDLTTGLMWLKKADWGGEKKWNDAHERAFLVFEHENSGLSDELRNIDEKDQNWRLPTVKELKGLTNGEEEVRASTPGPFSGVQPHYWSGSTNSSAPTVAWGVGLYGGYVDDFDKSYSNYVWPVRDGQ